MVRRLAVSLILVASAQASWAQPVLAPPPEGEVPSTEDAPAPESPAHPSVEQGDVPSAPAAEPSPPDAVSVDAGGEARGGAPESSAALAPSSAPSAPSAPGFAWQPFGYLRLAADLVQNDPDVAFVGRADGFDLQNARVGARGTLGARASFEVSFDGAVDERDELNQPNGRLRVGLRDAFVDLAVARGGALALRAGRFEAWFDPDVRGGDTERSFVDRPLSSRGVRATEGWQAQGLPPGRSLGVAGRWQSGGGAGRAGARERGLAVELAAQNGAAEFASDNDNDALALSLAARVWSARGWAQLAARYNPRTEGDLPFRQEETDLAGSAGAGAGWGPVHGAVGVVVVRTSFATTGGEAQRALGLHAQVEADVPAGGLPLRVGYRFALLDPSSLVLSDRVMEHTLGATLHLPALRARVQLGAVHVAEQDERALRNDRLEAALEVSL